MRFIAPAWRRAWAVLLLVMTLTVVDLAFPRLSGGPLWSGLAWIAVLLARGALWRVTSKGRVGPGGLQLGAVEGRLALVWALSAVFLFVLGLLFFVVILGFAYAAASAGSGFVASQIATWAPAVDSRGRIMVSVVGNFAAGLLTWAYIRISLAGAATAFEGRLMVLESWPLTRGRVLKILVTNAAIVALPAALLALRDRLLLTGMASQGAWTGALAATVLCGLWLPMSVGLMAYFYERRARPA